MYLVFMWVASSEFVSFLQAVFVFIELAIYKHIWNVVISNYLSNDQNWDSEDNLLSWNHTIALWKWQ